MGLTPAHRSYVSAQARELATEIGLRLPEKTDQLSTRELLQELHRAARDQSLPMEVQTLVRAEAKLLAGRVAEAETQLKELVGGGIRSSQVEGLARDRLGDIQWWRGLFREAAEYYRRALELRPDDRRTRKDLARALWHLGETSMADEAFGEGTGLGVAVPAGSVAQHREATDVVEVLGLYVSANGAGVIELQGCLDDSPGLVATGSLGTVAQESCDLAWSIWRRKRRDDSLGVRIHAPKAGVLKDGPSLGLAVFTLFGALLGELKPRHGDAFTGEVDLKGRVLPVGGIWNKAVAAYLTGLRRVFLPQGNASELTEGFESILELHPVSHVDELGRILR